ncbi:TetR/AcrR family transcriptional regulator [Shewanella sp. WXL01]|uniref:TetR/AcrR family transcriptional regulator n=1 Tax=Shewanella sp. WXL01 TaxID=2709721 RepID=UPI0014384339|nr:TetR/AcrR family transcriptional regulator [Shewanella sp. WXL01]NKF50180.1 TetR/AcrR family transcriptional regulator [Shewanella sp. WXL01]
MQKHIPNNPIKLTRSEQKRQQILTSAIELFCNQGFVHTSMDEVAKLAGVSKQTVYSHFGSKDILFASAIESKCVVHQLTGDLLEDPAQPELALKTFAKHFGEMIISEEALTVYKACVSQADTHPDTSKLYYEAGPLHVFELLETYFAKVNELGRYHFDKPRDCAVRFCLMLFGEQRVALELGLNFEEDMLLRQQYLQDCADMFLRAYRADSR